MFESRALPGWAFIWVGLIAPLPGAIEPARAATDPAPDHRTSLTGDWGGVRPDLERAGLTVDVLYTFDVMGVPAGGISPGVDVLGNLDLVLELDLERLIGWSGASVLIYGLGTHGGIPTERIGDLQTVNNIEAPVGWKLFEASLSQHLFEGRLRLRAGLYDVNSEFDVIPAAAFFVHSSFGMGGDWGTSGKNGPSTFPVTSVAFRVEAQPHESWFVRAVVADGVPGDPANPGRTAVQLGGGDGVMIAAEVGFLRLPSPQTRKRVARRFQELPQLDEYGRYAKYAIGAWGYTTDFSTEPGRSERGAGGAYALVQQTLFREKNNPLKGLTGFLRIGSATERGHPIRAYLGGGVVYEGLLPLDHIDRLGFGLAVGLPSDRALGPAEGDRSLEVAFEAAYRIPLLHWFRLQPDFQAIIDPAGLRQDAVVLGLRTLLQL